MENTFDQIRVGINIRQRRKSLGMTLGELANGICSVGKMSSIENGASEIKMEILMLFADKLNISHTKLLSTERDSRHSQRLEEINIAMTFSNYKEALNLIKKTKTEFEKELSTDTSLDMELKYLEAVNYINIDNSLLASTTLFMILKLPITSKRDVILLSQTHHKLGELYSASNHYRLSIEHFKLAVSELQKRKLEIPWRLYYNLCVLHICQRQYSTAATYLAFIKRTNPRLQYVNSLIHLLSGNYNEGMELLDSVKKDLLDLKDIEALTRALLATIYFSNISSDNNKKQSEASIKFITEHLPSLTIKDKEQIKLIVFTFQATISNCLNSTDKSKVEEYLDLLVEFENKHDYHEYRHTTLLLKGLYIKRTNVREADNLFAEAQLLMEKKGIRNTHMFSILYERSLINDSETSFAFKAMSTFIRNVQVDSYEIIQFENFMPVLISL